MNNETGEGCLVTGGSGRLATVLKEYWPEAMYDNVSLSNLRKSRHDESCDTVLHLAAYTNVDECEDDDPEQIYESNVGLVREVLDYCFILEGTKLIYASTYFCVAPGDEMGVYALSKRWGERLVQNSGIDYKILRIGYVLDNFLDWLDNREGDLRLNILRKIQPISYHTIARVIKEELQDKPWGGTYNVVPDDQTTPKNICGAISDTQPIYPLPILAIFDSTYTPRPQNTILKSDFNIGGWKNELDKEIARRKALQKD